MVKPRLYRLTRVSNFEPFTYEVLTDEPFTYEVSVHLSVKWVPAHFSLGSKQHRLIECLANNHRSSCMLAHGYIKGDERLSLPQFGLSELNITFYLSCSLTNSESI